MLRLLFAPILFLVLLTASSTPLAAAPPAQAFNPHAKTVYAINIEAQAAKAAFAAFKARFSDRASGFRTIKESQAAAVEILEQKKAQANWQAEKGFITAEQAASVTHVLDQAALAMEELAKQERRMVRNDTQFLKTFVQTLGQSLKDSAPQILAEQFGLPPLGARTFGSIVQGEEPATAALDALVTKLRGGELVEPSKEPFADLLAQVDGLKQAASALRGADRINLLVELSGVKNRISEISGLPIPQQSDELNKLRDLFAAAEGTVAELDKVRDGWVPRYAGPNSERFRNNPQWQQIWSEIVALTESPDVKIKNAAAAGMALSALEKVKAELIAQGRDPNDEDLDALAAQVIKERIQALASGDPITTEEAVRNVLGGTQPNGPPPTTDTVPATSEPSATAPPSATATTAVPTPTDTATATPTDTPTATPTPTPSPTPTATPTATATPTLGPPTPTFTPTVTPTPTEAPLPQSVSVTAGITLAHDDHAHGGQITLTADYQTSAVSGTLTAAWTVASDTVSCGAGDVVIDVASGEWSHKLVGPVGGGFDTASGGFSASLPLVHSWTFTLTHPFTHPDCVQFNSDIPSPGSDAETGTISGSASPSGAVTINVTAPSWTASWSGTGSVVP